MPGQIAEMAQFFIGAVVGVGLLQYLNHAGYSVFDPKTRWKTIGILVVFVFAWTFLAGLAIKLTQ